MGTNFRGGVTTYLYFPAIRTDFIECLRFSLKACKILTEVQTRTQTYICTTDSVVCTLGLVNKHTIVETAAQNS